MAANQARALSGKYAEIAIAASGGTPAKLIIATKWNIDLGSDIQTYNSIDGEGWQSTVAAVYAGTGSFEVTVSPDVLPGTLFNSGQLVALKLKIDTPSGAPYLSGDARLGKFNYSPDRAGMPQLITIPFQTDGPWTGDDIVGDLTGGSGFTYP